MAFLSKPTLLFLTFNALRLLSVVGLCLVFASEIVTINSCVRPPPLLSQLLMEGEKVWQADLASGGVNQGREGDESCAGS